MDFEVLELSQKDRWKELYNNLPADQKDILSSPDYCKVFEMRNEGKAICFAVKDGDKIALYPFLLNSVNDLGYDLPELFYDIQGVYGYNGILTNCTETGFMKDFSTIFLEYVSQQNIIAEFIRFNPVLKNHSLSFYTEPVEHLDNVLIDLQLSVEEIWLKSFNQGARNAVRKAEKFNVGFSYFLGKEIPEDWMDFFIDLYSKTMLRNSADKFYYFDNAFLRNLKNRLPENTLFTFATLNGIPVSGELILFDGEISYGFLSGTDSEKYFCSPNSLLRHHQIMLLKSFDLKWYSIGGGQQRNDPIFKYKKSFSTKINSFFYIGKKIHNTLIYNKVVDQWKSKYPDKTEQYKNHLLCYRYTS